MRRKIDYSERKEFRPFWEKLFLDNLSLWIRRIRRCLRNEDHIYDVLHDFYLRVIRLGGNPVQVENHVGYLSIMLDRHLLDVLRKSNAARRDVSLDDPTINQEEITPAIEPDIQQILENQEYFENLSPKRESSADYLAWLMQLDGFSKKEIASRLGESIEDVERGLARIKYHLQKKLKRQLK